MHEPHQVHTLVHQHCCLAHTGSPTLLFSTHWFINLAVYAHTGSPTLLLCTHWFTTHWFTNHVVYENGGLAHTGSPTLLFMHTLVHHTLVHQPCFYAHTGSLTMLFTKTVVYHTLVHQPHHLLYLHLLVIHLSLPLSVCLGRILTHVYSIWGLSSFSTCVTTESP